MSQHERRPPLWFRLLFGWIPHPLFALIAWPLAYTWHGLVAVVKWRPWADLPRRWRAYNWMLVLGTGPLAGLITLSYATTGRVHLWEVVTWATVLGAYGAHCAHWVAVAQRWRRTARHYHAHARISERRNTWPLN